MNTYYSDYNSATGTLGVSLSDYGNATFNQLVANTSAWNNSTSYSTGNTVIYQGIMWKYINPTASSNHTPVIVGGIASADTYWEPLGSQGSFTWIAYSTSANGSTDFTTGVYNLGGIIRKYIGVAYNKATATESTTYTDYAWSKFLGDDGTSPLIYNIVTSTPVIVKDSADATTAGAYSSVTIQGKKYDGSTTTNYGWVTVTANGDTEATLATDTATSAFTLSPATTAGKSSYTIKLYNQATVSGATLLDTQTLAVVFKGAAGTSARAVSLSAVVQAFAYDSSGATPSPANTVITASALNTSGTVYYEFLVDGTSVQNTTTNTYTYTPQALFSNMPDTVRVNIREGGVATTILASDTIAITGLKNTTNGTDGLNALTTVLSNAAHTLPTTNAGVVTYTGSGTTIRLYEGTTELLYDGVGTANSSWRVVTTGTGITPGTLTDSGTYVTVGSHSAVTATTASVSYNILGKRANGSAIDLTVVQTLSKSIQGDNGANSLTAVLSNESYTFSADSTGAVTSYVGSGTLIRLYEGATELVYDGVGTANSSWTVTSSATNITRGTLTDSGNYVTVGDHSGVAAGTDTSSIVYTITGKTSTGAAINLTKSQTFSKSKAGSNGTSGTSGTSPITTLITKPTVSIPTDSDGLNQVYSASSDTRLSVLEGNTTLTYDGVGTSNGTWKILSVNTIATLSGVSITGTAGQFSCTAAPVTLAIGTPITITGTFTSGSITGYTTPKTYYIIATNGSTTFTLSATSGGAAVVTTVGTPGPGAVFTITTIATGTVTSGTTYATYSAVSSMVADTAFIEYTFQGTNSIGTTFTGLKTTQTFIKVRGAVLDGIAPDVPTGLAFSPSTGTLITTTNGDIQVKLTATWNANAEDDFSYYIVAIQEGSGTFIEYNTTSPTFEWMVKPNTSYNVKVRAADKSDNRSAFCTVVPVTTIKKTGTPNLPTGISAVATFKNIYLSWTNPVDTDLAAVEVYRFTSNTSASGVKIGTVNAAASGTGVFTDSSGILNGTLYYYWLKSVDTSGNVSSALTATSSAALTTVTITGTAGQFSCASSTLKIGQVVIISGTLAGTGSITGYTTPKTYVISATNGTTTFTLVNTDGTAIVTTAGTPTGLTYTRYLSAAVPAAVGAADIIAGSITADRIRADEITSDLIAVGTGLDSAIVVSGTGTTIGTVTTNAADPAAKVNSGTTAINPGKIYISGTAAAPTSTMASWQNTTDSTKIEGGSIAANTVAANSMQIGVRGLDASSINFQCSVNASAASTNIVTWTAGTITYTNDAGTVTTAGITAGTTATWSSGIIYIYWTKGGTTLGSTTASGTAYTANTIVLATYSGGFNLVVNRGATIIDGSKITAGTITATQVKANSITATQIDSTNLTIKDGTGTVIFSAGTPLGWTNISSTGIPASVDNGQSGINRANIQYSEFNQSTIPTLIYTASTAGYSSAIDAASPPITGIGSIRLTTANTGSAVAYAFLGTAITDYNIVLKPNTTYLLSAYVKSTTASVNGSLRFRLNDIGTDTTPVAFTTSATISTWTRVSGLFTTNAATTSGIARLANLTNNCSIWYSGIMIEEAMGSSVTTPSPYIAPSINGQITSNNVTTFIQDAAIGSAQIGSIALVGTSNFSVKTSPTSTVSRIEMDSQVIKIFEGSILRVKIGNLA